MNNWAKEKSHTLTFFRILPSNKFIVYICRKFMELLYCQSCQLLSSIRSRIRGSYGSGQDASPLVSEKKYLKQGSWQDIFRVLHNVSWRPVCSRWWERPVHLWYPWDGMTPYDNWISQRKKWVSGTVHGREFFSWSPRTLY